MFNVVAWSVRKIRDSWNAHWKQMDEWREEDPEAYWAFIMEHGKP